MAKIGKKRIARESMSLVEIMEFKYQQKITEDKQRNSS